MAVKTKAQIHAEINSLLADNVSNDITPNDVRTPLHDIVDSYFDAPYKKYVALISQASTSNPTVTVLENTLGQVPTITRVLQGEYELTVTGGLFVQNKTWYNIVAQQNGARWNIITWANTNKIIIDSTDAAGNGFDDCLFDCPIEIRVYQ